MYSRSLYSFSSVKFFLANRAFIIPLLFFKIKYVFLLHYSINIVKTTQKRQRIEKIFCTLSPAVKQTFAIRFAICQWKLSTPTDRSIPLTRRLVLHTFEAGMLICCKADIRNPLRYLLMNAVASRSVSGSFQLPLTEAFPLTRRLVLHTLEAGECLSAFKFEYLLQ